MLLKVQYILPCLRPIDPPQLVSQIEKPESQNTEKSKVNHTEDCKQQQCCKFTEGQAN